MNKKKKFGTYSAPKDVLEDKNKFETSKENRQNLNIKNQQSANGLKFVEGIMKKQMKHLKEKYFVKRLGIFGSYSRGEETPESDIDILVEFSEVKSLLELIGIENELSEALKIKVDLLTEKAISPYLIEGIRRELEVIYE